jgi:hypothetical protein
VVIIMSYHESPAILETPVKATDSYESQPVQFMAGNVAERQIAATMLSIENRPKIAPSMHSSSKRSAIEKYPIVPIFCLLSAY